MKNSSPLSALRQRTQTVPRREGTAQRITPPPSPATQLQHATRREDLDDIVVILLFCTARAEPVCSSPTRGHTEAVPQRPSMLFVLFLSRDGDGNSVPPIARFVLPDIGRVKPHVTGVLSFPPAFNSMQQHMLTHAPHRCQEDSRHTLPLLVTQGLMQGHSLIAHFLASAT